MVPLLRLDGVPLNADVALHAGSQALAPLSPVLGWRRIWLQEAWLAVHDALQAMQGK